MTPDNLRYMFAGPRKTFRIMRSYPAPWRVRIWMFVRNMLIKGWRRSLCCGNHGQPGC